MLRFMRQPRDMHLVGPADVLLSLPLAPLLAALAALFGGEKDVGHAGYCSLRYRISPAPDAVAGSLFQGGF